MSDSDVLLFTTYLTSKPQPQSHRAQPQPDDPAFIVPWIASVTAVAASSRPGLRGVVLHDQLSDDFTARHTSPAVRFVRVPNIGSLSNNDARYEMVLEQLEQLPQDTRSASTLAFLTDGADCLLLVDPREALAPILAGAPSIAAGGKPGSMPGHGSHSPGSGNGRRVLFIGSEEVRGDEAAAARAERTVARARELLASFAPSRADLLGVAERQLRESGQLLNPGVLGGLVPTVKLVLCLALGAMRCADATVGAGSNANTPAFHALLPTFLSGGGPLGYFTGPPLHTRFGAHERHGAVFAHK